MIENKVLCIYVFWTLILSYYMLIKSMGRLMIRVTSSSSLSLKNWALPSWLWMGWGRWRPSLLKREEKRLRRWMELKWNREHRWERRTLRAGSDHHVNSDLKETLEMSALLFRGFKIKEGILKASLTILASVDQGILLLHPGPDLWL